MLINISDGQLHEYLECIQTFRRFYDQFYQNYMQTFILLIFRFYLNFTVMIIILHKFRGIVDVCTLDRTARFFP